MILECTNCNNRYLVDPRAVGKSGRKVRCAKCRHEWFAKPPQDTVPEDVQPMREEAAPVQPRPVPPGSSVPAIRQERKGAPLSLKWMTAASLLLFLATAALYFRPLIIEAVPQARAAYAALGIYDTRGIVFANLEYAQTKDVSKDSHRVSGYVVNTAPEARRLPLISVSLHGAEGQMLRRIRIVEDGMLPPGEYRSFSRELPASPESARRVVIETGSPFELQLR